MQKKGVRLLYPQDKHACPLLAFVPRPRRRRQVLHVERLGSPAAGARHFSAGRARKAGAAFAVEFNTLHP